MSNKIINEFDKVISKANKILFELEMNWVKGKGTRMNPYVAHTFRNELRDISKKIKQFNHQLDNILDKAKELKGDG